MPTPHDRGGNSVIFDEKKREFAGGGGPHTQHLLLRLVVDVDKLKVPQTVVGLNVLRRGEAG